MKVIGKLLHVIFSFFFDLQSVLLIPKIVSNSSSKFSDILLNSFFLNLFITGIFTIVYSFPLYKLLPNKFYNIHNPRLLKKIYKILQIELYRKFLLFTFWRKEQNKKYYFNGTRNGFSKFEIYIKRGEFGHFLGFITIMILNIYIGLKVKPLMTSMIFIVNILFNFYPFMLQRYHRLRLNRIKNKLQPITCHKALAVW